MLAEEKFENFRGVEKNFIYVTSKKVCSVFRAHINFITIRPYAFPAVKNAGTICQIFNTTEQGGGEITLNAFRLAHNLIISRGDILQNEGVKNSFCPSTFE